MRVESSPSSLVPTPDVEIDATSQHASGRPPVEPGLPDGPTDRVFRPQETAETPSGFLPQLSSDGEQRSASILERIRAFLGRAAAFVTGGSVRQPTSEPIETHPIGAPSPTSGAIGQIGPRSEPIETIPGQSFANEPKAVSSGAAEGPQSEPIETYPGGALTPDDAKPTLGGVGVGNSPTSEPIETYPGGRLGDLAAGELDPARGGVAGAKSPTSEPIETIPIGRA